MNQQQRLVRVKTDERTMFPFFMNPTWIRPESESVLAVNPTRSPYVDLPTFFTDLLST